MRKSLILSLGLCAIVMAFTSCKSKESSYKQAYERAKQQELATAAPVQNQVTPAPTQQVQAPVVVTPAPAPAPTGDYRSESVQVVSGEPLRAYSVVCGSFGVKANAENLKNRLAAEGYNTRVVYNQERNMYRVIMASYDSQSDANKARLDFKASHSNNADFQKSWLLYTR